MLLNGGMEVMSSDVCRRSNLEPANGGASHLEVPFMEVVTPVGRNGQGGSGMQNVRSNLCVPGTYQGALRPDHRLVSSGS